MAPYTKSVSEQHHHSFLANPAPARTQTAMDQDRQFKDIGDRLRSVRAAFSDLSQKDWAAKHGFNTAQYSNWENGIRRIPLERAEKLCDLYGLDLDFIYRGKRDGLSETSSKKL